MLNNHKSNSQLNVGGKMNAQDAGKVGKMQAVALIILACGLSSLLVCFGISLIGGLK